MYRDIRGLGFRAYKIRGAPVLGFPIIRTILGSPIEGNYPLHQRSTSRIVRKVARELVSRYWDL